MEIIEIDENIKNENKSLKLSIFICSIIEGAVYTFCPTLFFVILSIFIFILLFSTFTMLKHFVVLKSRLESLIE